MINLEQLYKYETHCHTSEASACSVSTASEMVESYYKMGYSGLIVTDHFFNGNTSIDQSLDWETRIHAFCLGYENALKAAKDLDFSVIFGLEFGYKGTDFLVYGIDKDFLLSNPEMLSWSLEHFFDKVHEVNGFIVHAHPFRQRPYINKIRFYPDYIDAVEVFNSGNDLSIFNDQALAYAIEHNFIQTRGSDSHDANNLAGEGIYFDKVILNSNDLLVALRENNFYTSTN